MSNPFGSEPSDFDVVKELAAAQKLMAQQADLPDKHPTIPTPYTHPTIPTKCWEKQDPSHPESPPPHKAE